MLRVIIAAGLVAALYAHSPHRPTGSLLSNLSHWAGPARDELVGTALTSEMGQALAHEALRRTLDAAAPTAARVAADRRP